jgi:hypothetical protein
MRPHYALVLLGLLATLAPVAAARQDDQATLRANLEEELAKEFVKHGGWLLDYGQARARAAKEEKVLFVYFTRTYAP